MLNIFKRVAKSAFTLAEGATHVVTPKNCCKFAFTLAEVLITLGIIGVVAALTMPTLIQNHQKQVYVTALKKAYSNIQNAFAKMALDEDTTDWVNTTCGATYINNLNGGDWGTTATECFDNISKQFNVVKKGGLPDGYKMSDCNEETTAFVSADGMIYLFECSAGGPWIYIDVNGIKGPNKSGRDVFEFIVNTEKNKIVPRGIIDNAGNEVEDWKRCTATKLSLDCTAKVIIEGKMDY